MKKEKKPQTTGKKILKGILFSLLGVLCVCVLVAGSYVLYVVIDYNRLDDNITLEVNSNATKEEVETNSLLTVTTLNYGFGAYSDEYSFFMDSGYLEDGTKVHGKYGKAISYDDALANTKGCINIASSLESDFYLFQEIDLDSDRCYHINQNEYILEEFTTFDSTFAINFHSAYLFYPFNDPHGKTTAGLSTLSSYKIESATRKRYTISDGFDKYLDLDRCFSVNRIKTDNDKELVLINSHMSAYDEGGVIRNKQLNELNLFMLEEVNKGNYVVCGGDFNHDLLSNNPLYPQFNKENFPFKEMIKQPKPDWINYMFSEDGETILDDEFSVYGGANEPSCRGCEIPWTRGYNFVTPVDGFITSSNVEVIDVVTTKVGENGFEFSDHQPVTLSFKLL